jgi:PleD family two-component response regulator
VPITVSVGVAMADTASGPALLLELADGALYRAKAEGRDRVVVSGSSASSPPS